MGNFSKLPFAKLSLEDFFQWQSAKDDDSLTMEFDRERQHAEDLRRIRGLRLIDDAFMTIYFR